jgi:hypothetical protein
MTQSGSGPSTPRGKVGPVDLSKSANSDRRAGADNDELLAVVGMLRGKGLHVRWRRPRSSASPTW